MKRYCHQRIIGIDVSKEWLDVAIGTKCVRIKQTAAEMAALIKKEISDFNPELCVVESTGGYERLVVGSLQAAGFKVHIAHPSRVRAFAKAKGWVAKTDRIDAFMLAWYGDFMGEEATISQRTDDQNHRTDLQARVDQLKQMLHGEHCRFKNCVHPQVKSDIEEMIVFLRQQIAGLEAELNQIIQGDPLLKRREQLLLTMKGVGPLTARSLLIHCPELGTIDHKKIAALIGVAPMTQQSGKKMGYAKTRDGRERIRQSLYMAALVAMRHNSVMKIFYERLRAAGKPAKVAIVAVMRKMVVTLNAMVRNSTPWQATFLTN